MRVQVAVHLAFVLRKGEVFAARWRSLDPDARTITVTEAVYGHVIDSPKTKGSIRVVPLYEELVQLLSRWKSESKRTKPDDFILAGRMGIAGDSARMLRDHIKPACRTLKLKPATWLTFRRSWNTWADGQGISPKIRGAIVGNSEEINSRIYTQTIPETLHRAVETVGEALFAKKCAQIVRISSPLIN